MVKPASGRYRVRVAQTDSDVKAAQALRYQAFIGGQGRDCDDFDTLCTHFLIEEVATRALVACFRLLPLSHGADIGRCYSAQFYDISALKGFDGKMAEMGRFCSRPGICDPDILRLAWGAVTGYVDDNSVEMLFGCTSFAGMDTGQYADAFALLKDRHLAPARWLPQVKAHSVFRFAQSLQQYKPDEKQAMRQMPPLLRTYLAMGGWVSDHAVIDAQLNTLHVFTGLEIGLIPAVRKRQLRAVAQ